MGRAPARKAAAGALARHGRGPAVALLAAALAAEAVPRQARPRAEAEPVPVLQAQAVASLAEGPSVSRAAPALLPAVPAQGVRPPGAAREPGQGAWRE